MILFEIFIGFLWIFQQIQWVNSDQLPLSCACKQSEALVASLKKDNIPVEDDCHGGDTCIVTNDTLTHQIGACFVIRSPKIDDRKGCMQVQENTVKLSGKIMLHINQNIHHFSRP